MAYSLVAGDFGQVCRHKMHRGQTMTRKTLFDWWRPVHVKALAEQKICHTLD